MLSRLAGDRDLALQLAAIFVSECPRMIQAVRDAVEQGAPDAVRRAAHALKGSTLNFVDGGAAATAFTLENMGREGDLSTARETLARLERELAVLVDHLNRFQADSP
jgi:HPt (histidine-containing phosphotransfer) domain-containing protein